MRQREGLCIRHPLCCKVYGEHPLSQDTPLLLHTLPIVCRIHLVIATEISLIRDSFMLTRILFKMQLPQDGNC